MQAYGPYRILGHVSVAVGGTSADEPIPLPSGKVLLVSTVNACWETGVDSATAVITGKYLPANTPIAFEIPPTHNFIAAIEPVAATDGVLSVYSLG